MNALQMRYVMIFLLALLFLGVLVNMPMLIGQLRSILKERKSALWLWILFFVAIVNLGKVESENILTGNIFQLATIFVIILCALPLVFLRLNRLFPAVNAPVVCLLLYASTGMISATYSPFPAFSLYRAALIILSLLVFLVSMSYESLYQSAKKFINLNLFFFFVIVLAAIVGAVIDPARATEFKRGMVFGMLKGSLILINSNSLAVCAGVLALCFMSRFMNNQAAKQKFYYGALCVVNIAVMIFAQSRTCIIAFIIALFVLFSRKRFKYLLMGILIAVPLTAIYSITSDVNFLEKGLEKYMKRGQTEKQWQTWSGRLTAWEYSWGRFKESPILGYGMEAGVRFGAVSKELQGSHLHSSYFETLLNSGLIGFIPWLLSLIFVATGILSKFFSVPKWFDDPMRKYHTEITAIFVFLLVRTFTGTTFVRFDYFFMLYLAFIAYLMVANNKTKANNPEITRTESA
jgi:O-antigen ligase